MYTGHCIHVYWGTYTNSNTSVSKLCSVTSTSSTWYSTCYVVVICSTESNTQTTTPVNILCGVTAHKADVAMVFLVVLLIESWRVNTQVYGILPSRTKLY